MGIGALVLLAACIDLLCVFCAARLGRDWLVVLAIVNFILFGLFASILIQISGVLTNAGNVFYACLFLATHFLLERYGRPAAMQTIFLGVASAVFFAVMLTIASHYPGVETIGAPGHSLSLVPRVFFGSLLAFVFSQHLNITVFEWLKQVSLGKRLWLRSLIANSLSQLVASGIFLSVTFFDSPGSVLLQGIAIGWAIKSAVGAAGIPLLYLDRYLGSQTHSRASN